MRPLILAGATVLFIAALLFAHPLLLGLPGRIEVWRYEHGLQIGMTRDQVMQLWDRTRTGGGVVDYDLPGHSRGFPFIEYETICVEGGEDIHVRFDDDNRVRSWSAVPWDSAC